MKPAKCQVQSCDNDATFHVSNTRTGKVSHFCTCHAEDYLSATESDLQDQQLFLNWISGLKKGGLPRQFAGKLHVNAATQQDPIFKYARSKGVFAMKNSSGEWTLCFPSESFDIEFAIEIIYTLTLFGKTKLFLAPFSIISEAFSRLDRSER